MRKGLLFKTKYGVDYLTNTDYEAKGTNEKEKIENLLATVFKELGVSIKEISAEANGEIKDNYKNWTGERAIKTQLQQRKILEIVTNATCRKLTVTNDDEDYQIEVCERLKILL